MIVERLWSGFISCCGIPCDRFSKSLSTESAKVVEWTAKKIRGGHQTPLLQVEGAIVPPLTNPCRGRPTIPWLLVPAPCLQSPAFKPRVLQQGRLAKIPNQRPSEARLISSSLSHE